MMIRLHIDWGVTAHSTEWAAIDFEQGDSSRPDGGYGFVRVVAPGVVYFPPAIVEGLRSWIEAPRTRGRGFAMPWPEDVQPTRVRTLLDFHRELAPRRATLDRDDVTLRAFDEATLQLVQIAERVHRAGGTLGFLQPGSVLVCNLRDGQSHVVLPDLGFAWDDQRGLMEPKWITDPEFGFLFEEGARKHNSSYLAFVKNVGAGSKQIATQAAALEAAQAADVRLIARLIAVSLAGPDEVQRWCGEGRAFLKMPGRNVAPDTQAPIWDRVIAPSLAGGIKTCGELAERLDLARPSEHFLFKPPVPPPLWKKAVRRSAPAVAGVGLITVLGGIGWWLLHDDRPAPPLCPTTARGSALYPRLFELVGLQTAAFEDGKIREYWDELKDCRSLVGGGDCISSLLAGCAEKINESARTLVQDLRTNPLPPTKARERLEQTLALVREAIAEVENGEVASQLSLTARLLGMCLQSLGGRGTATASAAHPATAAPRQASR